MCGTLRECFTLAAHVYAAGRCSIPHLPCTFLCAWWSHTEASQAFPGLAHKALHASLYGYKWSCPVPSFSSLFCCTGLRDTKGLQPGRVCFSSGLPACAECCWEAGAPWYRVWLSLESLCQTQLHPPDSRARHCAASPGAGGDKAVRCVMDTIGASSGRSEIGEVCV